MPQVFEEVEMTSNTWISSKEALRRAKAQDATAGDLLEWARQGKLRARAQKGSFSDDEPGEERIFPSEPPVDEVKRSVAGDWPYIPADFWEDTPSKALWAAGTFATRMWYFDEHSQQDDWIHITLFDVKFKASELDALLEGTTSTEIEPQRPKERWQAQRPSEAQRAALEFMDIVRKFPGKGPLAPVPLHREYCEWAQKKSKKPYGRSTFAKWANRYDDGWRLSGNRWVYNP